jgi:cation-transporting ATPase 13A1
MQGHRVIALAWRPLVLPSHISLDNLSALPRDELEKELRFAGFVVFECPLKPDSRSVCDTLRTSSHQLVMVTGDNELTACHVARELGIVNRTLVISRDGPQGPLWSVLSTSKNNSSSQQQQQQLLWNEINVNRYDACVLGSHIQYLPSHLFPHIRVFARATPEQKSQVLVQLKQRGHITLMCGDGTNDVGALKQAHVGVALLNPVSLSPTTTTTTTNTSSASTVTQASSKSKRLARTRDTPSLQVCLFNSFLLLQSRANLFNELLLI